MPVISLVRSITLHDSTSTHQSSQSATSSSDDNNLPGLRYIGTRGVDGRVHVPIVLLCECSHFDLTVRINFGGGHSRSKDGTDLETCGKPKVYICMKREKTRQSTR